jgi:hypothetical protein
MTSLSPSATPGGRRYDLRGRERLARAMNASIACASSWLTLGPYPLFARLRDSASALKAFALSTSIRVLTVTIFFSGSALGLAIGAIVAPEDSDGKEVEEGVHMIYSIDRMDSPIQLQNYAVVCNRWGVA